MEDRRHHLTVTSSTAKIVCIHGGISSCPDVVHHTLTIKMLHTFFILQPTGTSVCHFDIQIDTANKIAEFYHGNLVDSAIVINLHTTQQPTCCRTNAFKAFFKRIGAVESGIQLVNTMYLRNIGKCITGQRHQIDIAGCHVDRNNHDAVCMALFNRILMGRIAP